jgi:hypothetical protein
MSFSASKIEAFIYPHPVMTGQEKESKNQQVFKFPDVAESFLLTENHIREQRFKAFLKKLFPVRQRGLKTIQFLKQR